MFATRIALTALKRSTGIVGLDVQPRGREMLQGLYTQILEQVKPIPETSLYREDVVKGTTYKLNILNETTDVSEIESKIARGQLEELIQSAKDELELIPYFIENELWKNEWTPVELEEQ